VIMVNFTAARKSLNESLNTS